MSAKQPEREDRRPCRGKSKQTNAVHKISIGDGSFFFTTLHATDVVNAADFIATAAAAAVSVTNSSGLIPGSQLNDPFASRATVGPGADEGATHTASCLLNLRQRDNKPSGRSFSIMQTPTW
jgi:hypothetical protein